MAPVVLNNLPESMRAEVEAMAERDNRTVEGEILAIISKAVEEEKQMARHREALDSIERRFSEKTPSPVESVELLREDRER
jgi:plasmid stability protein